MKPVKLEPLPFARLLKTLCISALALLLTSCKPTTQITGQAFIVQNNRDTVKLSLLEVVLITEVEAEARIASVKKVGQQKAADAESRAVEARKKIIVLQKVKSELEGKINTLTKLAKEKLEYYDAINSLPIEDPQRFRKASKLETPDEVLAKIGNLISEGKKLGEYDTNAITDLEKEREALAEAEREINTLAGPKLYFKDDWTNVLAKCLTDADGSFTLTTKRKDVYIAAKASRRVFDNSEFYGWIVKPERGKMLLSNHNALASYSQSHP